MTAQPPKTVRCAWCGWRGRKVVVKWADSGEYSRAAYCWNCEKYTCSRGHKQVPADLL